MIRKIFLLAMLTTLNLIFTAEFTVIDYKAKPTDLAARRYEVIDVNGNPCALIKVQTDLKDLQFRSMLLEKVVNKNNGEYWVYVQEGTRRLKVRKEGILPLDFTFPEKAEGSSVYLFILKAKGAVALDEDLYKVTFRLNENNVYIAKGNSAPVRASGNTAVFTLPEGEFNFNFVKSGFQDLAREIKVNSDKIIDITLNQGSGNTKLKLPGIVVINSDPAGAEVYLNDQKVSQTPYNDQLVAGEYKLTIKKKFYYTHNSTFQIAEQETKELPVVKLKPKFGYYAVNSTPAEAKVYLDGIFVGNTPLARTEIESGNHTFKLEYDLYHTETREVEFKDGDDKNISFELKPAFGQLKIDSDPTGAELYINGKSVGKTPYEDEKIPSGKYRVLLKKKLWSEIEEEIEITDNQLTEKLFKLNKNFGELAVKAENSTIYLNGEEKGINSANLNLKPGKYQVTAKRAKHKDAEKTVFVNIGRVQEVNLKPEPIQGSISVFSSPHKTKGAKIFLNGRYSNKNTPAVMPLLIGRYDITLKYPGYLDLTKSINITEGENQKLEFALKTYEGSQREKRDFWRKQKWLALGSVVATAGAGFACNYLGDGYYDDFKKADNTTDAVDNFNLTEDYYGYRDIAYSVSLAPLGYFFYAWYMENQY